MNKCFLIVISFLLFNYAVEAQTGVYKPFPETYGDWILNSQYYDGMGSMGPDTFRLYYTTADTVVGSFTYKKVNLGYMGSAPPSYAHLTYLDSVYEFAYRNDTPNKKVYILLKGSSAELLWYDFNLSVGDSLNPNSYVRLMPTIPPSFASARVTTIDSIPICGVYHKRFTFDCPTFTPFSEYLVEGVGFTSHFIATHLDVCAFEPTVIFSTTGSSVDYSPCQPTQVEVALGIHENQGPQEEQLELSPNPVNTILKLNVNGVRLSSKLFLVIDCLGRIVGKGNLDSSESIDVSLLQSGFYSVTVVDKSGNCFRSKFVKE